MPRIHWMGRSHRITPRVGVRAVQITITTEPDLKIGDWILVTDDARSTRLASLSDEVMRTLFDVTEICPNTMRSVETEGCGEIEAADTSNGIPIVQDDVATPTTAEEITRDDGPTAKRGAKKRR